MTFVEKVLAGLAFSSDIDDAVDEWHLSESNQNLHEYLGLTFDEYALWAEQPASLNYILNSRKFNKIIAFDNEKIIHLIAARSLATQDKELLKNWLETRGYL